MLEIKKISAIETYRLRHQVLRPNQTIEDCKFDHDYDEHTFHVGAFVNGKLISIASFYKEKNPLFDEESQYRLRGMATLPDHRKLKAGSSILLHGEEILKKKNVKLWWCNARTSVSDYYNKMGLHECGEVFTLEPIGPHKLMYKKI